MINILFLILLAVSSAFAGGVEVDRERIQYDDALSFRDFTHWEFMSRPEYDFSNKTIYSSVFMHEEPESVVFAPGTRNVTFVCCNLDNVVLPPGSVVKNPDCGSQRRFKVQNDLRDWEVDAFNRPLRVIDEDRWIEAGTSVNPADIPPQRMNQGESRDEWIKSLVDIKAKSR